MFSFVYIFTLMYNIYICISFLVCPVPAVWWSCTPVCSFCCWCWAGCTPLPWTAPPPPWPWPPSCPSLSGGCLTSTGFHVSIQSYVECDVDRTWCSCSWGLDLLSWFMHVWSNPSRLTFWMPFKGYMLSARPKHEHTFERGPFKDI